MLMSAEVVDDVGHAAVLGVSWRRVSRWRKRWEDAGEHLGSAGHGGVGEGQGTLAELVREVLENAQPERKRRLAATVRVSDRQRAILEWWVRNAAVTPHRLQERCRVVLMSSEGMRNTEQARELGVDRQRVRRTRQRWAAFEGRLAEAEAIEATDKDLAKLLSEALSDAPRSGTPGKFTAEELAQIISVACESPDDSERPVSHWTPRELAAEVVKRGIVESISPRHLDRFLKKGAFGHTRPSTG